MSLLKLNFPFTVPASYREGKNEYNGCLIIKLIESEVKNKFRYHRNVSLCRRDQGLLVQLSSLKEDNCTEHPVSHGEGDQHAQHPGQTPAGLRQSTNVSNGVEDPRASEEAEVKQSSRKFRATQSVKKTDHHEGDYVLQVILMTPGKTTQQIVQYTILKHTI